MKYTSIIGEQIDQHFSLQELTEFICSSMSTRKCLLLKHTFLNCKIQLCFKNSINLSRIKSVTSVLAQVSGTLKHIVFELSVGLTDEQVGQQLTVLMQRPYNEISSLLLLNQMSLRSQEGKFMFSQGRGFILRVDLSFLRYCRDSRRLKVYLTQKIQKTYSLFSRELQRLIVFLRGKGEGSTSKGLIEHKEKLIMLTQVFQKQRQFRAKSTKINLSGCTERTTIQLMDLDFKPLRTKKITHSQLLQTEQVFDHKVQEIMKAIKESSKVILQGMRIKSICKPETTLCEGGFSKISQGIFDIELFGSINQESVGLVEQRQCFALVVKQHKKIEDYHALLNQQRFLVFARNNRCSHIGQYYSQTKNSSYFENGIYLQHYPNTLAQNNHLNDRQILNLMTQIAQGLSFLNDIGVAHRDIKLHNIMIDRQRRAKIIDFGSAAPIIWAEKCKSSAFVAEKDTRLTSTEGYYLPYKQAALRCVSLGDKFTREQYECHQNFDIFSFGVILKKKMCLNLPCMGDYVRQQLLFMSKKCLEPNPDDRIKAIEAAAWLKCLEQYEWQRRCVWNYAQRKARESERNQMKS